MSNLLLLISDLFPYIIAFIAIVLVFRSVVLVGGREIAVIERRYFGRKMPQGRVIALTNEIGIQARTLGPGLHFLIPFLYAPKKYQFTPDFKLVCTLKDTSFEAILEMAKGVLTRLAPSGWSIE